MDWQRPEAAAGAEAICGANGETAVIEGVTVVTPDDVVGDACILIEGGQIARVGADIPVRGAAWHGGGGRHRLRAEPGDVPA